MGKTLDPKTRKQLARFIRRRVPSADELFFSFDRDGFVPGFVYAEIDAVNVLIRKWRTSFRKWVKENIK